VELQTLAVVEAVLDRQTPQDRVIKAAELAAQVL
jgi:hypothetical protein